MQIEQTKFNKTFSNGAYLILFFVSLTLYAATPDSLTQTVTYKNETITLHVYKESVRGPHFEALVQGSSGAYMTFDAGDVRTYLGYVDQYPDACVAGFLNRDNQLATKIFFDRGKAWNALGSTVNGTSGTGTPTYKYPTLNQTYISPKKSVFRYTNGIDVANDFYGIFSDVNKTIDKVEFEMCKVKAQYLRDLCIAPAIGRLIIRTASSHCPYEGISSIFDCIDPLESEWKNNQSNAVRFIASVVDPGGGGIAFYPGSYSAWGSDDNGDFEEVARHELGHNWYADDYHAGSPEGETIMCGNSISRFNGMAVGSILEYRDKNTKNLDSLGWFKKIKMPPYARLDVLEIPKELGRAPVLIDVLKNDHDCNGDAITLKSFDATSQKKAEISRSVGTGDNGADEISYKNPTSTGLDYFNYTISDATGQTAKGLVLIDVNAVGIGNFPENFMKSVLSVIPVSPEHIIVTFTVTNVEHQVTVRVYDPSGKKISTIASGSFAKGIHTVSWNGRDSNGRSLAKGHYFIEYHNGKAKTVKQVILDL